jgi:hypothetical protein
MLLVGKMPMLERRVSPQDFRGRVVQFGLTDWWMTAFTEEERSIVNRIYPPFAKEDFYVLFSNEYIQLNIASQWLNKTESCQISFKFSDKADEFYSDRISYVDRHFGLHHRCEVYYRWRHLPGCLDKAIEACERALSILEHSLPLINARHAIDGFGVGSKCVDQLRIIEEKRGNIDRALEICVFAKNVGCGDLDKHIARLQKKLSMRR